MSSLILAIERRVGPIVSASARTLLVLAVCAALWQVLSRFALRSPSVWTEIATRTLLIWCVFLGIAIAFRRGALVSVDLAMQLLRPAGKRRLHVFVCCVQIAFLLLLTVVGVQMAWVTRFQNMVALDIPMSYAYLAIPVGCLLSILSTLAHLVDPVNRELEAAI